MEEEKGYLTPKDNEQCLFEIWFGRTIYSFHVGRWIEDEQKFVCTGWEYKPNDDEFPRWVSINETTFDRLHESKLVKQRNDEREEAQRLKKKKREEETTTNKDWCDYNFAMRFYGVPEATLRRLMRRGMIEFRRPYSNGSVMFNRHQVKELGIKMEERRNRLKK